MTPGRRRRFGVGRRFVGVAVLVGLAVQACAFGTAESPQAREPRALAVSAARAIAAAPGVHYSLSIATAPDQGGLDVEGEVAFDGRRFSGTADGGAGGWMLFFGGPASGALVVADGLFVKTENGPWERQPPQVDQAAFLGKLMDRAGLSEAIASAFDASRIDPAVRIAPCGAETCQVVDLVPPAPALDALLSFVFGDMVSELPPDLAPVEVTLSVDPSGFPVRMDSRFKAGTTVTTVTLRLARLDPAPAIPPPIP